MSSSPTGTRTSHATSLPPKIFSLHLDLVADRSWKMSDNNGMHGKDWLNLITPGVDLILWALVFIVTLIRGEEPFVCLVSNLFKAFPVVLPKWHHYNWCISLWKEKPDLSTMHRDVLFLSRIAIFSNHTVCIPFSNGRETTDGFSVLRNVRFILAYILTISSFYLLLFSNLQLYSQ